MLSNRSELILSHLQTQGAEVHLSEIKALFPSVSESTLRRDLDRLAETGRVIRTYGGVLRLDLGQEVRRPRQIALASGGFDVGQQGRQAVSAQVAGRPLETVGQALHHRDVLGGHRRS